MAKHATEMTASLRDFVESERQKKVAALAFEFWLARAFRSGSPETDWLRADRDIRRKMGTVSKKRIGSGLFLVPSKTPSGIV